MNRLFFFVFCFLLILNPLFSSSQSGYLFVKKGIKKKRVYLEGDMIYVKLENNSYLKGTITLLINDTIYINGQPVPRTNVKQVVLKKRPKKPLPDVKTMALIAAGSALTSAGLALSKQATEKEAIIAGPVIGFGPMLIKHFGGRLIRSLFRKKFRIGKKFYLQVLDFHIPAQHRNPKSF